MKKFFLGLFAVLLSLSLMRLLFIGDDAPPLNLATLLEALKNFGAEVQKDLFEFPQLFESFKVTFTTYESLWDTIQNLFWCLLQILWLPIELILRTVAALADVWNLIATLVGFPQIPEFTVPNPFPAVTYPPAPGGGGGAR